MHVDNSVKFLGDLSALLVDALQIAKDGSYWSALGLLSKIAPLVQEAKAALPELKDLTPDEALVVGAAAYQAVAAIVAAA